MYGRVCAEGNPLLHHNIHFAAVHIDLALPNGNTALIRSPGAQACTLMEISIKWGMWRSHSANLTYDPMFLHYTLQTPLPHPPGWQKTTLYTLYFSFRYFFQRPSPTFTSDWPTTQSVKVFVKLQILRRWYCLKQCTSVAKNTFHIAFRVTPLVWSIRVCLSDISCLQHVTEAQAPN